MPGYVNAFRPLLRKPSRLSSLVPWRDVVDQTLGILSTKADGWLCCVRVISPDGGSLSQDAQDALTLRLNDVWKLLPPGSAVFHHLRRREMPPVTTNAQAPVIASLLEEEHLGRLNGPATSWSTETSISISCRPPASTPTRGFSQYLWRTRTSAPRSYGLEEFAGDTEQVLGLLRATCLRVERLVDEELTAYLHRCISVHEEPLALGEGLGIHAATADNGFWPGTVPIIGDFLTKQYVRALTLARPLPNDGTANRIFLALHQLPLAYDVVTRWIPKARSDAKKVTDTSQTNWMSMRHSGWRATLYEFRTGKPPDEVKNTFVYKQGDDADTARDAILSGNYQLGRLTMTFLVRGETATLQPTREELAEGNHRLMALARVVKNAGCSVVDDPINQTEAFVGTWPGCVYANVDTLEMTSLNFATLALSDTPWEGITWNTHLNAPPLTYARTEGCMRVGVDTFVGDRGNFLMVGPLGSGKSTALAFFDSCWLRDTTHRLYPFDVGRSNRCVVLCHGGQYHDGASMRLQIMADLDREGAAPWIFDWLKRRVQHAGVPKHPDLETFLWGGLEGPNSLRARRTAPRTLTAYLDLLQGTANKICAPGTLQQGGDRARQLARMIPLVLAALRPFAQGGAYGALTDAPVDQLRLGRVHGFELEGLLKQRDAYSAVLEIIFFRLRDLRDGSPTRYVFDEAWHVMNDPIWVDILTPDLPGWRRQNVSGGFAMQSLSQMQESGLKPLVIDMTQSRFWLPNSQALDEGVRDGYEGVQLGREEIERHIVLAAPRGEMYWTMPPNHLGHPRRRKIDLSLGPLARAVCGANAEPDHEAMDAIVARYPAEEFPVHWFAHQGFAEASHRAACALDASRAVSDA